MIQWVYERVARSSTVQRVLVATDDRRILDAVRAFGGECVMTSKDHPSGTDRLAEVARNLDSKMIVNVQGDEPLIEGGVIDACVEAIREGEEVPVATPCTRIRSHADLLDPNVVKVVTDRLGFALYFSRAPIPFDRGVDPLKVDLTETPFYQHIGLYVYRKDFLLKYSEMERTPLEMREKLEQLRILENGFPLRVVPTRYDSRGVDTPEDLEKIRRVIASGGSSGEAI